MQCPRCDVGVYCSETFFACLAESACLFLGLSFCLFRPDDPPMRLERLERRRRPRSKLYLHDITLMLQAAMNKKVFGAAAEGSLTPSPLTPLSASSSALAIRQDVSDSCVAYYMYTSGSTGDPKCVVASRGNLHAYLRNFIYSPDGLAVMQGRRCRLFCLSSPFFDPSIGDMLATLCTPQCIFYTCRQESLLGGCVSELMAAVRPTHVVSTPAVWRIVSVEAFRHSESCPEDPDASAMKVFLGGERMSQELISAWADRVELFNIYGVTEVTIYQSVQRVRGGVRAADLTCGSGAGTRIEIDRSTVDPFAEEGSFDRGSGEGYGEVVLYGDQVCCGYADEALQVVGEGEGSVAPSPFGYDDATKTRFFRTGDVGELLSSPDGEEKPQLVLRGRRDWQIKLNGQRVSIEEVEGAVQGALEGLFTQCVCFCIKGTDEVKEPPVPVIGAAVVFVDAPSEQLLLSHTQGVTAALQEVLALHLPSFMIPRRWLLYVRGSALPQTATGKVNRIELASIARGLVPTGVNISKTKEGGEAAEDRTAELHDVLYATVRSVWGRHLGLPVHANTHYLHAGGDSLGALKLTRAIYLSLHDSSGGSSDDGIDEHGGLPSPFQPCVVLQHPRFGDYVAVLRQELESGSTSIPGVELHKDRAARLSGASSVQPIPASAPPSAASPINELFREVVAAQCCGLAECLLRYGVVDVNGGNTRAQRCATPLHIAVSSCGNDVAGLAAALRMVKLLLDFGAKPTAVSPDGVTPAHLAAAVSAPLLRLLLDNAPPLLHCRDGRQQSLLHFAARGGNVAAVQLLLSTYRLRLDTRDKWQRTPTHWAVLNGHMDVLEAMNAHYTASTSSSLASLPTTAPGETEADASGGGLKRARQQGCGTARFTRLARKKTYLAYETLCSIAQRTRPGDEHMMELCRALSAAVGEEPASR
ncbi:hypothetical protein ABB37_01584 [Leptomonas pyrrhocoris]|uniref:AMP-dependent synthetase/ligase domain-containing protein n=1 Tax=Leptomonas pyrrhocoris TaxID=157538 RepID=A0A0N0DZF4_LEPPY|nr:hypothetical protein ABB37_01584 [Leptomonas pyrrhocoris]XP_015663669.1 hypothetical protein ABB37_01584 [Leptomonas pyrrhocoris]XP_015663670.1 hypothetical protein ABB37_01584 [Leptomonas pyrrhocoris]KPA85229.1 hypothetical protein ABB37_01584 [Leptomonas pyrrhocoris]KPA85230.1 hypothetical protein ABB37_01584 [Leptomonas pyrrhocoris]KPA85231.1 hypothetical protein ABB37_01584 [Leptomonas pyrrhocoris]|eukprot:XP_015663668.1 hypothetical protein ABB37_01584 [Leptomonas pyrrhocoris]